LKGKKLKGAFALVKLKNGDQDNAWLLIKHNDKYAVEEDYDAEEHTAKRSKVTKYWEENTAEKSLKKAAPSLKKESAPKAVAAKKKVLNKK
jgi:bifunctional non-homologous end joining protein LigD